MRRDEETTAKKVLDLKVKGKRPRGRPRSSWIKYIDNILKERGTTLRDVEEKALPVSVTHSAVSVTVVHLLPMCSIVNLRMLCKVFWWIYNHMGS